MSQEVERTTLPLPGELIRPVPLRPTLLTILAAFSLAILVNALAGTYLERYPVNRAVWLRTTKWTILDAVDQPLDWMFLGDSSCNQGVVAQNVADQLGGQARNLCTTGNMALVDDVVMLEEHITNVGVPRNVVVIHTWDVWPRSIGTESLGMLPLEWGYWEDRDLVELDISQEWEVWQIRNVPLVAQNLSLQQVVRRELPAGRLFTPTFDHDETGYMLFLDELAKPQRTASEVQAAIPNFDGRGFNISRLNRDMLVRLRLLADTHGFRLILLNGPLVDTLVADARFAPYQTSQDEFFNNFVTSSPQLHYVPGFFGVSSQYTIGMDHTTHTGAVQFTDEVITALREINEAE